MASYLVVTPGGGKTSVPIRCFIIILGIFASLLWLAVVMPTILSLRIPTYLHLLVTPGGIGPLLFIFIRCFVLIVKTVASLAVGYCLLLCTWLWLSFSCWAPPTHLHLLYLSLRILTPRKNLICKSKIKKSGLGL